MIFPFTFSVQRMLLQYKVSLMNDWSGLKLHPLTFAYLLLDFSRMHPTLKVLRRMYMLVNKVFSKQFLWMCLLLIRVFRIEDLCDNLILTTQIIGTSVFTGKVRKKLQMPRGGETDHGNWQSKRSKSWQCGGDLTPLIPSLGRQRPVDLQVGGKPGLHSEF